jgi:nitrogen fixation NifU-like protein
MTDIVIGLARQEATERLRTVIALLKGDQEPAEAIHFARIRALAGVREFPARVKCATLAWHALNSAMNKNGIRATTE